MERFKWCRLARRNHLLYGAGGGWGSWRALIGAISPADGRWKPDLPLGEYGMPDSLREVIARRLSRLSEAANRALKVAAVIGHEFDLATLELAPAAADDPSTLLDVLEESSAARLVVELKGSPGRFGFNHTLVRQTLLDALSATRRARLHRQTIACLVT